MQGFMQRMIAVREFPPREDRRIFVNGELRYEICISLYNIIKLYMITAFLGFSLKSLKLKRTSSYLYVYFHSHAL